MGPVWSIGRRLRHGVDPAPFRSRMEQSITGPDLVGSYADKIRAHLEANPKPFTVPELEEELKLSDRVIRMGLDRLVFTKRVQVSFRHDPHRRGGVPRQFAAA